MKIRKRYQRVPGTEETLKNLVMMLMIVMLGGRNPQISIKSLISSAIYCMSNITLNCYLTPENVQDFLCLTYNRS